MKKLKELLQSPHIQIALATGASIIALAYASKRLLPEPIGYLPMALPAFLVTAYEVVSNRYKKSRICRTGYWVFAILFATLLIILFHMI